MLKTFSVTNIGRKRRMNQDYVYSSEQPVGRLPNLFVVADGMGGHNAGDYASRTAVETIVEKIADSPESDPLRIFEHAIQAANTRIRELAAAARELEGMGTTVVAACVGEGVLYVANVGDSRLYVVNRSGIRQITRDHSWVEEMVRRGGLGRAEARNHPDKNIITRAIGAKDSVEVVFYEHRLKKGDIILMCTDGLTNMVEDGEIFRIVKSGRDIVEIAKELVEKANENGGKDNIGIVIAEPFAGEVNV